MPARFIVRPAKLGLTLIPLCLALILPMSILADSTPPITYLNLSGTLAGSGWYTSTVDVTLRASDLESSPKSTTYQLDSGLPVTNNFTTLDNAIINPSFENGSLVSINNWDPVDTDPANLYQSYLPAKYDYRSAAIKSVSSMYQYWTNVNSYVPVTAGNNYSASVWIRTEALSGTPGAWFEVWARDASGSPTPLPDISLGQSTAITGDNDWTLKSISFTVPTGYNGVYLKLGSQASSGMAFYDGASMYTGTDAFTQFTIVQNGTHSLTYHSTDNAGNVEADKTESPIKIDSVNPQDWSNFGFNQPGGYNAHEYNMWVYVRDVTSGVNPPTAYFQVYDKDGCNCWSDRNGTVGAWSPVDSVTRQDNGQPAAAGYTGFVKLYVNDFDYGNSSSSTLPQIHFTINDMATSIGNSPTYGLFNPWLQLLGGAGLYAHGGISMSATVPSGQYESDGMVIADGTIYNFLTSTNQYLTPYNLNKGANTLADYLPSYSKLLTQAVPLPGNKLPSASGVYSYSGNYTMDSNSITSLFQGNALNAVILINGNLTINNAYTLNPASAVAFLVTGDITMANGIATTAGAMIAAGSITTGGGGQLTHNGTFVGLSGLTFARDLGRKGGVNNTNTPAEKITFPASYFANTAFTQLLNGSPTDLHWQEGSAN